MSPCPILLPPPPVGWTVPNQVLEAILKGDARPFEELGSPPILISQKEKLRPREKNEGYTDYMGIESAPL